MFLVAATEAQLTNISADVTPPNPYTKSGKAKPGKILIETIDSHRNSRNNADLFSLGKSLPLAVDNIQFIAAIAQLVEQLIRNQ